MLLERGETARKRVAARIDDARVRQQQVDQTDIQAIVRHLVDEDRRTALAVHARAGEVALGELEYLGRPEPLDRGAVHLCALLGAGELMGDLWQGRQLDGALDLRVACEDLLEQGRARPRQTHDENRITSRGPPAASRLEELPGEEPATRLDELRILLRTVRMLLAPQRVAARIVAEGAFVRGAILESLAEREMQVQAILARQARPLERARHRLDVTVLEAKGLEVREAPPGLAEGRLQLERPAVRLDALDTASLGLECMPQTHPRERLARRDGEHRAIELDGAGILAEVRENGRLEIAVAEIARIPREQQIHLAQRRLGLRRAIEHHRVIVARGIEARREL